MLGINIPILAEREGGTFFTWYNFLWIVCAQATYILSIFFYYLTYGKQFLKVCFLMRGPIYCIQVRTSTGGTVYLVQQYLCIPWYIIFRHPPVKVCSVRYTYRYSRCFQWAYRTWVSGHTGVFGRVLRPYRTLPEPSKYLRYTSVRTLPNTLFNFNYCMCQSAIFQCEKIDTC